MLFWCWWLLLDLDAFCSHDDTLQKASLYWTHSSDALFSQVGSAGIPANVALTHRAVYVGWLFRSEETPVVPPILALPLGAWPRPCFFLQVGREPLGAGSGLARR